MFQKENQKECKMDFTNSKLFFVENWALHFMFLLHNILRQTDFAKLKKCKKEKNFNEIINGIICILKKKIV